MGSARIAPVGAARVGGISEVGIGCVVTGTGVSDLVSGRTVSVGDEAESVGAISAVGMGGVSESPWEADVGSVVASDAGARDRVGVAGVTGPDVAVPGD